MFINTSTDLIFNKIELNIILIIIGQSYLNKFIEHFDLNSGKADTALHSEGKTLLIQIVICWYCNSEAFEQY